jgi:hypothetical protein
MPKHMPLRPKLYAELVEALMARAILEGESCDLHDEAERIAMSCGMSPSAAYVDFQKTAQVIVTKARQFSRAKLLLPEIG